MVFSYMPQDSPDTLVFFLEQQAFIHPAPGARQNSPNIALARSLRRLQTCDVQAHGCFVPGPFAVAQAGVRAWSACDER
jgi:hypothetical protein